MGQAEAVIHNIAAFLQSSLGKAVIGLFSGVLCFAFPYIPGYAVGSFALYYAIHQFRPVAAWMYHDIAESLIDDAQPDGGDVSGP